MKKLGLLFVTVVMLMLFAVSASAATEGYYTYRVENGEATITDVDESISGDVTIPSTLGGFGVTSIGYNAFEGCINLTSITIPDSVTLINQFVFNDCESLTSITIPKSVTYIGSAAFIDCENLTSITVDENNKNYSNDSNGVLFNKNKTILLEYPAGNSRDTYIIPDSVTTIDQWAFDHCSNLTDITISDSVTSIKNDAFAYCKSLTSIIIPESVKSIDSQLFLSCESLTSITIPESVKSIGDHAFWNCYSLTSITIPESVTFIADGTFANCSSLKSIIIPNGVISIEYGAFTNCDSLTSITIPDSVTVVGDYVFNDCDSLINITIPDSVISIGDMAFYNCKGLTSISVDTANKYYSSDSNGVLFDKDKNVLIQYPAGNTRSSYIIPDSVTVIGDYAFFWCENLTSIRIPDSLTFIGNGAFIWCYGLDDIYYVGSQSNWNEISIGYGNDYLTNATIHFDCCTVNYGKHSYISEITTKPTCTGQGYTTYICECGDTYKDNYTSATGHKYDGQTCLDCGKKCSCNCHKSGFMGFIWKIVLFFNKLFKTNRECACGVAHF